LDEAHGGSFSAWPFDLGHRSNSISPTLGQEMCMQDGRQMLKGVLALFGATAIALGAAGAAQAYNYVASANGEYWGVQDSAAPRVDTGSIRDTTSNSLRGFGGIRVRVSTNPLRNGELVRGFGLRLDPPDRFSSTRSVDLGGVAIERQLRFSQADNWGRWLDTFKNTTNAPVTIDVAFGGQLGIGTTANGWTNAEVLATSDGDTTVSPADAWTLTRSEDYDPNPRSTRPSSGPAAVVIGTPAPFGGAMTRTANFVRDTFLDTPFASVHEANFVGYQNTLTLLPGETKSLVHFVVIGTSELEAGTGSVAPGAQVAIVRAMATSLASAPVLADLTTPDLCAIANWNVATVAIRAFDTADCAAAGAPAMPPLTAANPTTTGSPYDVVGRSIDQMQDDMEAGRTTSQQITRAYLDRIAAYDVGPWGLNSMHYVATDAMEQAKTADAARAAGTRGQLLGIPVVAKDLYDTKDMPTTNGSLAFEGFQPETDATQVALLRRAGAVILGKAAMEEYALSGQYSDDAWGQVWNAFQPSKSSIASSGGTAVATAADFAAAGLGSQTGDSLYGPASAASLWTLRGTDGIASSHGVWPLSWLQDFPGTIARSAGDLADMLNVTTGTDPLDPLTVEADAKRPADWRGSLEPNALRGKRIGYYASAFVDPFATTGTVDAQLLALRYFSDAGATLVQIDAPAAFAAAPGTVDRAYTGWKYWIDDHPNSPYNDPRDILANPRRLPYRYRSFANGYAAAGMMRPAEIQAYRDARALGKTQVAAWLDSPGNPVVPGTATPSPGAVDAVVFPGLRSDISLNDGGSSAFGRGDPPTNSTGSPSVAFPAGRNDHGEPMNLQLVGRAWEDAKLMGYAYAFDQVAHGHVTPDTVPPLPYRADPSPPVIVQPRPIPPAARPPAPKPVLRRLVGFRVPASIRVGRARIVAVRVRCTATATSSCRTTLTLRRGGSVLARRTVTLRAGRTTTVRLALSATGKRLLRSRKTLAVTLQASVRDASGVHVSAKRLVLKRAF
jgi:amidase